MAVDNRPFKSKEQDGQGNEVIIRDQQLVEQGTATTMASGACFETRDVDDRPVKIPRDNMMNIVLECIGIILNDSSRNLGTNVQKALGLQGNTVGHSTVADFASVLGGCKSVAYYSDITVSALEANKVPVIGMTEPDVQGGPDSITGTNYGIFAFFPARYQNKYGYSITLFALFDASVNFKRFFVRGAWNNAGTWKEVSLL